MPTLLKDVNLFIFTAYLPLIMKWDVTLIWDLILDHIWVNLSKNHDVYQKLRKSRALLYALSVEIWQPMDWLHIIYTTDHKILCCQNLSLYFGSFFGQFVQKSWFLPKMKKLGAYCTHSLLKASNLFRLAAFMPVSMILGVAKIRDLILVHFWIKFLKKIMKKQGPTVCILC